MATLTNECEALLKELILVQCFVKHIANVYLESLCNLSIVGSVHTTV